MTLFFCPALARSRSGNSTNLSGPSRYNVPCMEGRHLHVEGYEGKVVAIDRISDKVVASADIQKS